MKSRLSRETAQAIREDILEKIPQAEILQQYGIKKAMFSRIKSGKWFEEEAARKAKNDTTYPKGMGWCRLCGAVVKMPCHACKIRALANGKRSRYSTQTAHAAIQPDGTCKITQEPEPLVFQLRPAEEEARVASRFSSL